MISRGETMWSLILESGLKSKPFFSFRDTWRDQVHLAVKSGLPQTTSSWPQNLEKYKREFVIYFIIILNTRPFETWSDHPRSTLAQKYSNCMPFPLISKYFSSQP
jgi:hypothetical protein